MNNRKSSGIPTRKQSKTSKNAMTTDFGERKITGQNFSKVVSLPKTALANLGRTSTVNVELVQENGEKFLKLSPSRGKKK